MRITVNVDHDLLARAAKLSGNTEHSDILREALEALIVRETARRLTVLGGTDDSAAAATRDDQIV